MKKLCLFVACIATQFSFSQTTKTVRAFSKVNIFDQIEVVLVPTTAEEKIELTGENKGDVTIINKNGNLKIKMNLANSFQGEDIKAVLYYKTLQGITAEEGSVIRSTEPIEAISLNINAKTGSDVKLNITADNVVIKAGAGSIVNLKGSAKTQDIVSNSGATVNNKELVTEQTNVTVNAGGVAKVNASKIVDAKTRAGGKITIYGNPAQINEKTIAGGTITQAK